MKIRGNVVGVPNPQADWNQTDETKANYIRNKPSPVLYTEQNLDSLQQARARENIGAISDNLGGKGLSGVERIAFTDDQGTPHLYIVTALDRNEVPVLALIGSNEEEAPVRIENVADGIDEHNAATVGQLYAAIRGVSAGGGSSALIVTITGGVASHTSAEIYAHVLGGGTAFCRVGEADFYNLSYIDTGNAIFSYAEDDGYIYGVKVLDNGSFVPIEFSLADAISILPTITDEDNGKFLQAVNGVWVAVDAVPQMQALMDYYIEDKFLSVTQAEYDALFATGTVDESKYYMIVGDGA